MYIAGIDNIVENRNGNDKTTPSIQGIIFLSTTHHLKKNKWT